MKILLVDDEVVNNELSQSEVSVHMKILLVVDEVVNNELSQSEVSVHIKTLRNDQAVKPAAENKLCFCIVFCFCFCFLFVCLFCFCLFFLSSFLRAASQLLQ